MDYWAIFSKLKKKPNTMITELAFKYLHFISIFAIVSALVAEHLLLKPQLQRAEIARLAKIDAVYGIAALTLLFAGLMLWLKVGKPADFYTYNWIFHIKLAAYIAIGLLSIYPTIFFMKNRKGALDELVSIPKLLIWCIRIELILLFLMPLAATLMARGVGYFK